ncbi:Glycosyltransferase involved in cell wall bisynthesis [Algoriphagus alkaliphilus]|uniref:Glycosyltransferase involved in cell wall bisynthesis n=1 Tax=Algoriphagus alkaliphilus TaxID=279824 RepID=A0A1G5ZP07_9BACT|nr:glycosyltransferase [Algoriphagus alkaliphilus]SDA96307.1 Glycosyltransferase involved in cell wall bisynthesis [Algoriphagus alkaliphilus]
MKIVQLITRPQRRGAEIFAVQLSERLKQLGHEVIVVALYEGPGHLNYSGDFIQLNLPYRSKLDFKGFQILANTLKERNPDIVQANASHTLRIGVMARRIYGGEYLFVYRNANQLSHFIKGKLQKLWNQWLLRQVDAIASVSHASKQDLQSNFPFSKPIEVIPIGIDSREIKNKTRAEIYSQDQPYIIQIGGLVGEKDPLGMLEIFSRLSDQNIRLVFLGSGPQEESLMTKIKELDLESRVRIISNQANIFPILSQASALVMPSKIEGLPAVILEAMYLRVPIVAYGVGGIPEVLKNGETGWCVPPNDQNGFISALEEVLSMDTDSKEAIVSNAHDLVISDYTIEKVTLQFEDFYSRLIGK